MKNKVNNFTWFVCYLISFVLIGYYLILEFSVIDITSPLERLKIIGLIILLMYLGCYFFSKSKGDKINKVANFNMIVWFSLYIVMLLNLTLFDQYFGRRSLMLYVEDNMPLKQYFELNFNIIPFATINNFFIALKNNNLTSSYFFYNIFGNIIAFMPMAFFIPRLFKKIDKWYKFLIITSVFIVFIEIMQIILMTGSFDIDDYILNILGAFFLYMILNNKIIKKYLDKFLYLKC